MNPLKRLAFDFVGNIYFACLTLSVMIILILLLPDNEKAHSFIGFGWMATPLIDLREQMSIPAVYYQPLEIVFAIIAIGLLVLFFRHNKKHSVSN